MYLNCQRKQFQNEMQMFRAANVLLSLLMPFNKFDSVNETTNIDRFNIKYIMFSSFFPFVTGEYHCILVQMEQQFMSSKFM